MVVMVLDDAPPALRGSLTRWLLEIRPHVYVGAASARVRDRLWERAVRVNEEGSVIQIWSARTEQGFDLRLHGDPAYRPRDFEGLTLIARPDMRGKRGRSAAKEENPYM